MSVSGTVQKLQFRFASLRRFAARMLLTYLKSGNIRDSHPCTGCHISCWSSLSITWLCSMAWATHCLKRRNAFPGRTPTVPPFTRNPLSERCKMLHSYFFRYLEVYQWKSRLTSKWQETDGMCVKRTLKEDCNRVSTGELIFCQWRLLLA